MFTGLLVSEILIKLGAKDSVSYENPEIMQKVFIMWAILGVVCGILAMIPFFFWDLTEKRQLEMTKEIKMRAIQNKLDENKFTQEDVKEAMELGMVTAEQVKEMGLIVENEEAPVEELEAAADSTTEDSTTI